MTQARSAACAPAGSRAACTPHPRGSRLEAEVARKSWPFALAAMARRQLLRVDGELSPLPPDPRPADLQGRFRRAGLRRALRTLGADPRLTGHAPPHRAAVLLVSLLRRAQGRATTNGEHEDSGESIAHFLLVDDTGECVISPDGAEIAVRAAKHAGRKATAATPKSCCCRRACSTRSANSRTARRRRSRARREPQT